MTDNQFKCFHGLGYTRLVPIIPPTATVSSSSSLARAIGKPNDPRGKAVGIRGRDGDWRGYDWVKYENDEQDLTRWHDMGAGVGIKTGNGLVLIDADTKDMAHAKTIHTELDAFVKGYGVRVGQYPKVGYLVRTDPDFKYTRIEFGTRNERGDLSDRVEILAEGRQFVAHGIHPRTKKPYDWPYGVPKYDDLPYIPGSALLAFLANMQGVLPAATKPHQEGSTNEISQSALRGSLASIRAAVAAIPNTSNHFPSRESYRDMGYAIKAALPDNQHEAFEIFADWCAKWTDGTNDPDVVASDWRRMKPPYRRGASFIYDLAEAHALDWNPASIWFDEINEADEIFNTNGQSNGQNTDRFKFLDFDQAASEALAQSDKPLIKGLINQGTMIIVYGDSNVGKSFIGMDIGYHISAGKPYAGMRVEQGMVVYVAAEGGGGVKRRVLALREKYGPLSVPGAFRLLPMAVDLRRPDVDLVAFIAALKKISGQISGTNGRTNGQIALIVVDTLSRALAGGDENSSVDMGAIVKHFDAIRDATGAALMVVHHTGKNKANGARGHSLLRAATDTEIEIEDGLISVTKQRDLDKAWSSAFALNVVTLGIDDDGDKVTSCTVDLRPASLAATGGDGADVERGELSATEEKVLECLSLMLGDFSADSPGVTADQLLAGSAGSLADMSLVNVRFYLRSLKNKGHVVQPKRGFWCVRSGEKSFSTSGKWRGSGETYKSNVEKSGEKVEKNIFN